MVGVVFEEVASSRSRMGCWMIEINGLGCTVYWKGKENQVGSSWIRLKIGKIPKEWTGLLKRVGPGIIKRKSEEIDGRAGRNHKIGMRVLSLRRLRMG